MSLNVIQWNCRSLLPKITDLECYLYKENMHICICSESWLSEDKHVSITGVNCFRKDRSDGFGGLIIFVHNSIRAKMLDISLPHNNLDFLGIELMNSSSLKFVINIYSSRNVQTSRYDYDELFGCLNHKTLIGGDFNAHHAAWSHTEM
ncbi:unnamed protein product [Euphydryas editha]|uniref:Endonuclease/exonuclease/phosphatase domain-containing protein n=1 Tax=Euphydryas editha TaxID=104508 RepID=A0AAU9VEI6_EUPED|nr:unnamed protein product [Euphydryas editha]